MRNLLITLGFFLFILVSPAQENLNELAPLENASIVLLGEQTHGDGATFDKKVDLIKRLHQELNFNVVVFESGLYDNYKAVQLYQSKREDISVFYQSVYPFMNSAGAFQKLFDYVAKNPEMKIMGFDSQEGSLFKEYFISDLKNLFSKNNLSISNEIYKTLEKTLVYLDSDPYINKKQDSIELYSTFDQVLSQFSKINIKNFETKIMEQTFKSVMADFDFGLKMAQKEAIDIQNPRDKQMAENLIFLQEQFPDEKFIGWGASYHFANKINTFQYTDTTESYISKMQTLTKKLTGHAEKSLKENILEIKALKRAIPMGQILKDFYGNKVYSIGFSSYKGSYQGVHDTEFAILNPPENSLETILHKDNSDSRLIDAANFPKEKFYSSVLGYLPIFCDWKIVFDGIYYIPEMYPPVEKDYNETPDETAVFQENKISGTVIDIDSKKPIAYTDVYYSSNNKSVTANDVGAFSISKTENPQDFIIFSSIGYESDSLQVGNVKSPMQVALQKASATILLNEVTVTNVKSLTAEEILKKTRQKISANYQQTAFNQNFFFGVQAYKNDSLYADEEALLKTFFKKGNTGTNSPENNIYAELLQLRNTTKKKYDNKWSGVGSLWTFLIRDIILSKTNVLYRSQSYDLKKEGIVTYDAKEVYKISFFNTSPGSYSTGYGYPAPVGSNGFIYIEKESFAVLYYEHCVTRDMAESKKANYKWQTFHKITQSYKKINGKYFINLFKVIQKTNLYSKENDAYLGNSYEVRNLMSENIEINNVTPLARPLMKLKQKISLKENSDFWKNANFYIKDDDFRFESCE